MIVIRRTLAVRTFGKATQGRVEIGTRAGHLARLLLSRECVMEDRAFQAEKA